MKIILQLFYNCWPGNFTIITAAWRLISGSSLKHLQRCSESHPVLGNDVWKYSKKIIVKNILNAVVRILRKENIFPLNRLEQSPHLTQSPLPAVLFVHEPGDCEGHHPPHWFILSVGGDSWPALQHWSNNLHRNIFWCWQTLGLGFLSCGDIPSKLRSTNALIRVTSTTKHSINEIFLDWKR